MNDAELKLLPFSRSSLQQWEIELSGEVFAVLRLGQSIMVVNQRASDLFL